jgi:hypothetical protein
MHPTTTTLLQPVVGDAPFSSPRLRPASKHPASISVLATRHLLCADTGAAPTCSSLGLHVLTDGPPFRATEGSWGQPRDACR